MANWARPEIVLDGDPSRIIGILNCSSRFVKLGFNLNLKFKRNSSSSKSFHTLKFNSLLENASRKRSMSWTGSSTSILFKPMNLLRTSKQHVRSPSNKDRNRTVSDQPVSTGSQQNEWRILLIKRLKREVVWSSNAPYRCSFFLFEELPDRILKCKIESLWMAGD